MDCFTQRSESGLFHTRYKSGLFHTGHFTTDVYNALQISVVFLTDVPKSTCIENVKTPGI